MPNRTWPLNAPATQAWKRQRLADAAIVVPPSVRYVGVDFERGDAFQALRAVGFNPAAPACFAWLGVTMYLSEPAVVSVLQSIAALAPGTAVAFDYAVDPSMLSEPARRVVAEVAQRVAAIGEPWTLFFHPERLAAQLRALGFVEIEDLGADAINARYFSGRPDGLRVGSAGRLLHAARQW